MTQHTIDATRIASFKSIILKPFIKKNKIFFDKKMLELDIKKSLENHIYLLFVQSGIIKELDALLDKIGYLYGEICAENNVDNLFESDEELSNFILNEYIVLRDWIDLTVNNHSANFLELINCIERDKKEISRVFNIELHYDQIKSIDFGLSDKHRGGKSVGIITLIDGSKLVYKPRNLTIDVNFNCLLQDIINHIGVDLKIPKVIDREKYGWVEYVRNDELINESDAYDYYKNLGVELALLYVLEATDFHFENIIASGKTPTLIDLESFFHPYFPIFGAEANQSLEQSVLRTGILPDLYDLNFEIDNSISGVSAIEGQEGILDKQQVVLTKDNQIKLVRDKGVLISGLNIPVFKENKVNLTEEFIPSLIEGFKITYQYILTNRDSFVKNIEEFKNVSVRVLFRDTVSYVHLLDESTHPSVLKNYTALDTHLSNLSLVENEYKLIKKIVPFEKKSLLKRDVPLFTSKVNSRNLWYSDDQYIENFFEKTGYETVLDKINGLSFFDLNRQINIIQNVLSYRSTSKKTNIERQNFHAQDCYINECELVFDFIKKSIFSDENKVDWLIKDYDKLNKSNFVFLDPIYDLYSGMPGEILFLYFYNKTFKDQESHLLAEKAYRRLVEKIDIAKHNIYPLGLYTGWGSIILLNSILGSEHFSGFNFFEKNEEYFSSVNFESIIERDTNFSLLKGSAGFIVACLHYYERSKSAKALKLALYASEHLLKNRTETPGNTTWKTISKMPLTGLAHGSSGFILTFAKLYSVTKDEKYKKIVYELLKFENSFYSDKFKNWKDNRDSYVDKDIYSSNWAHGSGGIAVSRLTLIRLGFDDEFIKKDLINAVNNILNNGFNGRNSLISGDLGNIEFLITFIKLYDGEIGVKLENIMGSKINQIKEKGWFNGIGNPENYTLGLMNGVTGIGYTLLRYINKDIPSLFFYD